MEDRPLASSKSNAHRKVIRVLVSAAALATLVVGPARAQCPGIVSNGDFANGLQDWETLTNSPQLNGNGCNATNSLQMWGNQAVGESVKQELPGGGFLAYHTYRITVSYRWLDINPTAQDLVRVRFAASGTEPTGYPPVAQYPLIGLTPDTSSTTSCDTYTFPDWTPTTNMPWLTINPENDSMVNDGALVSWAQIDDICIEDVTPPLPRCEFDNCRAKQIKASMVPAFVSCGNPGGNTPNGHTVDGSVPSCAPPQKLSSYGFKPGCSGKCTTTIKAAAKTCEGQPCCCISTTVGCSGIVESDLSPANGNFSLDLLLRLTENDPLGGDMTLIDIPFTQPMTVTEGKLKFKGGCLPMPSQLGVIPKCSAVEVVDAAIRDPNGDRFAVFGVSCCGQ